MNKALEAQMTSKPFLKGLLCADQNGLLIAAKGELAGSTSGTYTAISHQAALLCPEQAALCPPTILIETSDRNTLIKDYGSMTVVLRCARSEES